MLSLRRHTVVLALSYGRALHAAYSKSEHCHALPRHGRNSTIAIAR